MISKVKSKKPQVSVVVKNFTRDQEDLIKKDMAVFKKSIKDKNIRSLTPKKPVEDSAKVEVESDGKNSDAPHPLDTPVTTLKKQLTTNLSVNRKRKRNEFLQQNPDCNVEPPVVEKKIKQNTGLQSIPEGVGNGS